MNFKELQISAANTNSKLANQCKCCFERETDRERQREAERGRERQREVETDRDRQRQTERGRERQREAERGRERQRETERENLIILCSKQ